MANRPEKITGGCLCGSVRYDMTFPEGTSWPADVSQSITSTYAQLTSQTCSCQCSICRKFSGSLISHDIILKPHQLSDITKAPTYSEYQSSEGGFRSFCSNCGSGLTWRISFVPDMIIVFLGTIDEQFLIGNKIEGSEEQTENGLIVKRDGGLCKDLTGMNMGHLYWNNRIPNVTDQDSLNGPKFPQSFPME